MTPMLARLARELPVGERWRYEPKWDGFRCLARLDGAAVELRSRNDRPLGRYFPEVVEALGSLEYSGTALDGELLACGSEGADFEQLLGRLHPAASRVARLREEAPARYIAFDVLAIGGADLVAAGTPFDRRRAALERLVPEAEGATVSRTPLTTEPEVAGRWLRAAADGVDGVVAKDGGSPYLPGKRAMVKVKLERTADVVVGGLRLQPEAAEPAVASLLLGLYDGGTLHHVGVAASFRAPERRALVRTLAEVAVPLAGHPWEHGFVVAAGRLGHLPGTAGRWLPGEPRDWLPVRPVLVCEVGYDRWEGDRFRHAVQFKRWRPDLHPSDCRFDQFAGHG